MNSKSLDDPQPAEAESRHQCLIYDGSPSRQLPALAAMMHRKIDEDFRCLYLNSRPMVAGVRSCLAARGIDVEDEVARARLVLSSESIAPPDGDFDCDTMLCKLEDALDDALRAGYRGLWATGDMTWEFGSGSSFDRLVEYECKLEALMCKRPELAGICQYHRDTLPFHVPRQALLTHRTVFVNETLSYLNSSFVPSAA